MSHANAYDKKTAARDGATFQIEWQYDDSPDLSYLGEYTDKRAAWQVDCKEGVLLGDYTYDNEKKFSNEADALAWHQENYSEDDEDYRLKCSPEVGKKFYDLYGYHGLDVDETLTGEEVTLVYSGYDVLARDLHRNYDHNSYRYFIPPVENYKGTPQNELIKYCIQDYKRMVDLNRGDWAPVGCVVTMFIDGEAVAYASLWGIESDAGDYLKEVEEDLISECISDARKNSAALAAKYRELADKLENLGEE
jgi:hypothetical protein